MKSMSIYHLRELLEPSAGPCLSLYQPTHRSLPDRQQDPIRYRNLVAELERSLVQNIPKGESADPAGPVPGDSPTIVISGRTRKTGSPSSAWPGGFQAYRLQRTVPELAVVADSLHSSPWSDSSSRPTAIRCSASAEARPSSTRGTGTRWTPSSWRTESPGQTSRPGRRSG